MEIEFYKFKSTDGVTLDGFLKFNKEKSKSVLLAIHGIASNCLKKRDKEISETIKDNNIDTFVFNNRGSEIFKYLKREKYLNDSDNYGGSAYENIYDCKCDIEGAMKHLLDLGYENIYLCGHSLGATKIVYTYNELVKENSDLLKNIKGILLLSLVDLKNVFKNFVGDKFQEFVDYAEVKEKQGKDLEFMPQDAFFHPLSVKTFLIYNRNNERIDFAKYSDKDYDFKELNSIKVPLFMRWGLDDEFMNQNLYELVELLKDKINNSKLDIGLIDNADHCYRKQEKALSKEISEFFTKNS